MRNLSKVMAGSMLTAAALTLAACQPGDTQQDNVVVTDTDPTWNEMDTGNDVTAMDATGNEAWGNDMDTPIENAQDLLDNAQQELQRAQ